MTTIVQVNVTQTVGSIPTTLQKSGALISQGATTNPSGISSLITKVSDLTAILRPALAITSIVIAGTTVTATVAPHGYAVGSQVFLDLAGVSIAGYNGTFLCTFTTATQFTYTRSAAALSTSSGGTYRPTSVAEVTAMATTFFAQGSNLACYVLELGPGSPDNGVTTLTTYLQANPNNDYVPGTSGYFYAYVVPRSWDANANFLALLTTYSSLTSRVYFFVTTTLSTYTSYISTMKSAFTLIESPQYGAYPAVAISSATYASGLLTLSMASAVSAVPGDYVTISGCVPAAYNGTFQAALGTGGTSLIFNRATNPGSLTTPGQLAASLYANAAPPVTEFSVASCFWRFLNQTPSAANLVPPFAFGYSYGTTAFPNRGQNAILASLKAANTNVIGSGSEGGIANTIILWGVVESGQDLSYWYSVDWVQINMDIQISNAIINGSNNSQNPLYYDQNGINRLQAVAEGVMRNAISFGLALSPVTTNAIPFVTYVAQNPSDYTAGIYGGLSVEYTPQRGFTQILFYVNVSSFPTAA